MAKKNQGWSKRWKEETKRWSEDQGDRWRKSVLTRQMGANQEQSTAKKNRATDGLTIQRLFMKPTVS